MFEDGDRESGVHRRKIRFEGQEQRETLQTGDEVDARCVSAGRKVLPATVVKVHEDGRYTLRFHDNGETEDMERKFIFAEFIDSGDTGGATKARPDTAARAPISSSDASLLAVGTKVQCRYGAWSHGALHGCSRHL